MKYNFNDYKNWVHPEDLRKFEKQVRNFVFTKKGKIRKHLLNDIKDINTNPDPESFIDTQVKKFQSAHRIHNYMKFRAYKEFPDKAEKERYDFDPQFYFDSFKEGCYDFFGIECCECCGKIIRDKQNPEAYSRFVIHEKSMKGPTVH